MQLSWSSGKPPLFYSTAIREARQGKRHHEIIINPLKEFLKS
ncbi:hypothetical protein ALC56_04813 [Trachymyrmex septentrionalis]|uniref:Uncharacterized protein n=1 Tax=Trachymyrmex septentrionalis TaxID=34720 RepID=A0A151JY46_9HYME|nr:hypothetical protein ALC56_04813 [Trachymyrmex septentrionalis]